MSEHGFGGSARPHVVVINDEEQYSIWPADRPVPSGWRSAGMSGTTEACLDHIGRVWTDMRPRSVRLIMEEGTETGP